MTLTTLKKHNSNSSMHVAPQLPALRALVAEEGWGSLWHGVRPRVLFHVPAAAVCWGTYESCKRLLGAEGW